MDRSHLLSLGTAAACLLLAPAAPVDAQQAPTVEDVYSSLNMRTVPSALSQRLKYHCESYLADYFPRDGVEFVSSKQLIARQQDEVWTIAVVGPGRVSISTVIGKGSYRSSKVHAIRYNAGTGEWRGEAPVIAVREGCVALAEPSAPERSATAPRQPAPAKPAPRRQGLALSAAPARMLNQWSDDDRFVERFEVADALAWDNGLVVTSQRLANFQAGCDVRNPERCPEETRYLSWLSLEDGTTRRITETPLNAFAQADAKPADARRISNGYLLEFFGPKRGKVSVTRLADGERKVAEALQQVTLPLNVHFHDFAVHGDELVIVHYETQLATDSQGRKTRKKKYWRSRFGLEDLRLVRSDTISFRPVLTSKAVYSWSAPTGQGGATSPSFRSESPRGSRVKGEWPASPRPDCGPIDHTAMTNDRYHLIVDKCGVLRGIELEEARFFHLPYVMADLFGDPEYTLLESVLLVASRTAGSVAVLNLATGKWEGRLPVSPDRILPAGTGGDEFVAAYQGACPNGYGSEAAVLRTAYAVQKVRLSAEGAGASGATAPLFDAGTLGRTTARAVHPADRVGATVERAAASELRPANSKRFHQRVRERRATLSTASVAAFACETFRAPLHVAPGGDQAGWLQADLRPGRVASSVPTVWLVGMDDTSPLPGSPAMVRRDRDSSALLAFGRQGQDWINVSHDAGRPLWLQVASLPPEVAATFEAR